MARTDFLTRDLLPYPSSGPEKLPRLGQGPGGQSRINDCPSEIGRASLPTNCRYVAPGGVMECMRLEMGGGTTRIGSEIH